MEGRDIAHTGAQPAYESGAIGGLGAFYWCPFLGCGYRPYRWCSHRCLLNPFPDRIPAR